MSVSPSIHQSSLKDNKFKLYNTIGNVCEMVDEKGLAKGGSWNHPYKDAKIENQFRYEEPQAWVGIRSVCEWVDISEQ